MEWPLLEKLPAEDVRRVLATARRRTFSRGEVIFHEGDPADSILLISKGRVAIRITTPLGHTATLSVIGRGAFLGELALLATENRRSATAVAIEPAEAMAIHVDAFEDLRRQHPSITDFLVHILADIIRRQNGQLVEALYVPADTRVLRRLVELVGIYGGETIPLTQEDLAGLAGTTRATVNRVLREEVKRGTLDLGRGKVSVLDLAAIERRAQ